MAIDKSGLEDVVGPTDEQIRTIARLAERQLAAERQIEQLEAELAAANENHKQISWNLLPDAMRACNCEQFKLQDGTNIDVKEQTYASITEANRPIAHAWLRNNNHGAIIKNNIVIGFSPGQDESAAQVADYLEAEGIVFDTKQGVNVRTLAAWVKGQLLEDNEIPDSITYYQQRISKVKTPKG
jgi:hypothetical protein